MNRLSAVFYHPNGEIYRVRSGSEENIISQVEIETDPYLLTSHDVDKSQYYIVNGEIAEKPEKPSDSHVFDYANGIWSLDLSLAKDARWAQIKSDRFIDEFGSFKWNGYIFQCDEVSQRRIQGAVQLAMMSENFTIDWTLLDNTVITLTAQEMIEVGQHLAAHVNACHVKSRQLRTQIDAAESIDAINLIEW
jgi:hypothetical protein